jgi:hypothetical protein
LQLATIAAKQNDFLLARTQQLYWTLNLLRVSSLSFVRVLKGITTHLLLISLVKNGYFTTSSSPAAISFNKALFCYLFFSLSLSLSLSILLAYVLK